MSLHPLNLADLVRRVVAGQDLSSGEAETAIGLLADEDASPTLTAAFLTGLRMKGETPSEVAGLARGLRRCAVTIHPTRGPLVDTCGTGGGDFATFNISTAAAFVAAGAGVVVAKHGNRAVTSACGSADVLEALGVRLDLTPERLTEAIDTVGIGFLFAPAHHPALRRIGAVRRELPFRTTFNCLGPLVNPARATRQVIGVYDVALLEVLAGALSQLDIDHVLVVHGSDGLDEISTVGPTDVIQVFGDGVTEFITWTPEKFGLRRVAPAELAPRGTVPDNARLVEDILVGEAPDAAVEVVLFNAAAAILVGDLAPDLEAALDLARESIRSGNAARKLRQLVDFTQI